MLTFSTVIFVILAVVTLGAALAVVTMKNVFHAALMLVLAFFGVAGFYVLLEANFFAAAQVLVYIGAISILIIFAVMLTRGVTMARPNNEQSGAVATASAVLFVLIVVLVGPWKINFPGFAPLNLPARAFGAPPEFKMAVQAVTPDALQRLGRALVDQYMVAFLLAGVLLLLAMIGAVWVARERKLVEIVKERREMAAEEAAAAVPPAPAAEAVATTDAHH